MSYKLESLSIDRLTQLELGELTLRTASDIGNIPATAILIFAFIDLSTGFCAACWAYAAWYKFRESTQRTTQG